jgi:hypothetical protein
MEDVFEKMKDYKLNALARSQKTVDEDTLVDLVKSALRLGRNP